MKTILVCGGRNYDDAIHVAKTLRRLLKKHGRFVLVHGAASGADSLADAWGRKWGLEVRPYPANWKKFRKAAGPIRNQKMLRLEHPDIVVAFPGGDGTEDMVAKAKHFGCEVVIA